MSAWLIAIVVWVGASVPLGLLAGYLIKRGRRDGR